MDGDEVEEQEDASGNVLDRGGVDEAVGQKRGVGGSDCRHPCVQSPPQSSRSLSPTNARRGTSARAPSDENRALSRATFPRGVTSARRELRVGAGALVTGDVTPGALARGLVDQPRVWCLALVIRTVSSILQWME